MNKSVLILGGIFLSVFLVYLVGAASAHSNAQQSNSASGSVSADSDNDEASCGMHANGTHSGMMGMMHGGNYMGSCINMDIDEMDKDKDGKCDYCGMPVEDCEEMAAMHSNADSSVDNGEMPCGMDSDEMTEMHNEMHNNSNTGNSEMSCGMHSNGMHSGMHAGMMGMNGMH